MAEELDLARAFLGGDYGSEFEYDGDAEKKKESRHDLATKPSKSSTSGVPSKHELAKEYDRQEGRNQRFHYLSLDAYARHKQFVNNYLLYYGGSLDDFKRSTANDKTDLDVIREHHKFLWNEDDDTDTWAKNLSKKYWDKLFKEYTISDLSRYKENKIALRWRVEKEVIEGKGQFECGNKKCKEREGLRTWEVNFGYIEHGEKKNALVKLRLCPECSYKLNYHHKRREVTKQVMRKATASAVEKISGKRRHSKHKKKHKRKHKHKHHKKKKKRKRTDESDSDSESSSSDSESEEDEETNRAGTSKSVHDVSRVSESEAWSGPAKVTEEKSREDEFDEYFEDMFL
ncbi:protein FRA10AC1 homolog [Ptychodera flava]|uniref:protein FRA10AC1 homolog n=1 Tax=Ptychodera flava TaxID=63121 RepID=UPI00396AAF0A